jgi:hypothetical protein
VRECSAASAIASVAVRPFCQPSLATSLDPPRPRSWASVVRAADQPSLSSPTTLSAGTRASVKKTSLNDEWPFIWRSGRTSTPLWSIGRMK